MSVVTATILSAGQPIDPTYGVISIDIRREVNRVPWACVTLLDGDTAAREFLISSAATFEPGKEVEIKLRHEGETQDKTVFKGRVVRHGIEVTGHGSFLRVELKDAAVKLTGARRSAVFRAQTDDAVISKLITSAGLKAGTVDAMRPEHPELVQYACTDWDFILSRADAQGMVTIVLDGEVSVRKPDTSAAAAHTYDIGLSEIYNFEFNLDGGSQVAKVKSVGWDIKKAEPTAPSEARRFALAQGNLDGARLASTLGFDTLQLNHLVPAAPEELKAWADGRMMRSRMSLLRGRLATPGSAGLRLLDVISITGAGKRFDGNTLITGIAHRVDANGWRTDVQFGLSPRAFSQEEDILDAPAAGLLPGVSGLQIGLVDGFEEDPEKESRVRVILPAIDTQAGAVWARLATPDAGKDRGYFFRPEPGDEVVVGFFNEDPRQPVILGSLYGSRNNTTGTDFKLDKDNFTKGITTRSGTRIVFNDDKKPSLKLQTKAANQILLNDDGGLIEISDQHGNKITLDKDGIRIESAKDLTFKASSGKVQIEGTSVDVK